jgi:hypothetical protein
MLIKQRSAGHFESGSESISLSRHLSELKFGDLSFGHTVNLILYSQVWKIAGETIDDQS